MNKLICPSPAPRTPEGFVKLIRLDYGPPTNYDWLPTKIQISNKKEGTSIHVRDHRFDRYFECVDKWNLEIDIFLSLLLDLIPIAENKSKKIIGGTLKHSEIVKMGKIHLLPPPTRCDICQVIEILLDLLHGEQRKMAPPWRKDIEVPRVKEIQQKIQQEKHKQIQIFTAIQEEISELQRQMLQWDSHRDLLTSTGDYLESIVQKALSDVGIKTKKTEKGFPADLISNKVAIEITGIKGCVGVGSEKVNQTGRFKQNYHKGEKIILIANTHMDLSPQKREGKIDFSPEVKKYFEALGVCCLTSKTLFELWKDVVTGKKDSKGIVKKILTKNGELMPSEFE